MSSADALAHTRAFTDALFQGCPEGMYATLWTLQGLATTWVPTDDPETIALTAQDLASKGRDVYIGVSVATTLPPEDSRHRTRISSESAAGLFGMWADIDIADPNVHAKWNLPADENAAIALARSTGLEPSIIVHSGHGIQCWWLFPEFWTFEGEADRRAGAALAERWNHTLRVRAAEHSQTVDAVFDLARIMRVPGTMNRKGDPLMPVKLISTSPNRYLIEDFEAHCLDDSFLADRGLLPTRTYQVGDLVLTADTRPDFDAFQAALENDEQFAATWARKRKDFADQSPSTYDMSLASQAAAYGWSDQEIASLVIAFRRQHKLDVAKALRKDYMDRTIARARDQRAREHGGEAIEDATEAIMDAKQSGDQERVDEARRQVHDVISQQLGLQVVQIRRYTSEPPSFRLVTPTGEVDLGNADGILKWDKFREALWRTIGHTIPRFKQHAWDKLIELIPKVWIDTEIGFETTDAGEVYAWLSGLLDEKPPVASVKEALEGEGWPYTDSEGRTVIFGPALKRHLWTRNRENVSAKEIGKRLRNFGAELRTINVQGEDGGRTSRSTWVLPENWQKRVGA